MSAVATIDSMIAKLEAAKSDAQRHDNGQNAAGTRLRKVALEIKNDAADFRKKIQEERNARKG